MLTLDNRFWELVWALLALTIVVVYILCSRAK